MPVRSSQRRSDCAELFLLAAAPSTGQRWSELAVTLPLTTCICPKMCSPKTSLRKEGDSACVRASVRPSERQWLPLCASWQILMALLRSRAGKPQLPAVWISDFTQTFAVGRTGKDICHPRSCPTRLVGLSRCLLGVVATSQEDLAVVSFK